MATYRLRRAHRRDASAIAALHAASWRSAYRDVLPARRLGPPLDDDRRRRWRSMLARARARDVVLVADDGERLLGFIAVWVDARGAYIDNLHVDPARRGNGIGAALLRKAARHLVRTGTRQAVLWVYVANTEAVRFYERQGGVATRRAFDRFLRSQQPCHNMVWRRLERLAF
jgi:ribosomal protein S18 acetylase RimI-like enzyme